VANLERALAIAGELAVVDSARTIDEDQIQVELANAREEVQSAESSIRSRSASVKRDLGLSEADSIAITHVIQVDPVFVDIDEAVRFAEELTPRMRQLDISQRNSEIRHEETKGRGGFEMNLNFSYGREKRDDEFSNLWQEPDNSYTVNVTADVPIWDWGERKARVAASEISFQQTLLRREEQELEIVSNVRNEVLNVQDRESRTLAMQANMELAREVSETSFQRYQTGQITVLDLVLSLRREADTVENFLDAYTSWKESLRSLRRQTYYDYEEGIPVLERFGVQGRMPGDGAFGISLPKPNEGVTRNRGNQGGLPG
jgi:outer membrane protein